MSCKLLIIKIKTYKLLKCFTLRVMNLKYMKVSRYSIFFRCTCTSWKARVWVNFKQIFIFRWTIPLNTIVNMNWQWAIPLLHINLSSWMNEWCIYKHFYCVLLYTQSTQSCGGGLLNHHQCAASTWWCDGCHRTTTPERSPHTSYRWRGERVIEPIKWMGLLGGHDWQGPVEGNLVQDTGGTPPTLYEKCHGIFKLTTESQDPV